MPTTTSIRVEDSTLSESEKMYGKKITGLQIAAAGYFDIQRRTLEEIRGVFTRNELYAIADNLNGVMRDPRMMCDARMLVLHLIDGEKYEGVLSKWEISAPSKKKGAAFFDKLEALTSAQCYFLQDAVFRFWESGQELEEFAASLS
jgi:hypothetical protein